jgi:hypothetical protein
MNSLAKRVPPRKSRGRGDEPQERIVVERLGEGVTSIRYLGRDPETRYLPRPISFWGLMRESWRHGV